jgi:hypothetical protein
MKFLLNAFCVLLLVSLAGCGQSSSPPNPKVDAAVNSTDELKSRLQQVADTGIAGSALAGVQDQINQLSDATKKDDLLKDYQKLSKATNPAEIKKIANEMISKL